MSKPFDEPPVPGLDEAAARRWLQLPRQNSPWLHEEVARRMIDRLEWFREPPSNWLHWEPDLGGQQAHRALRERLPGARVQVWSDAAGARMNEQENGNGRRWNPLTWWRGSERASRGGQDETTEMLWANMVLHMQAHPLTLMRRWHQRIAVGGFLMFSCLGPDSLKELRDVYARESWPDAAHRFTDMHDWGDMLVQSGFAEPVMDMEQLTLTYSSASAMLDELRGLGRNLSSSRFSGLRGRGWRARVEQAIEREGARAPDGRLVQSFQLIYGHAFKAERRSGSHDGTQSVSIDDMRTMLRTRRS